MDSLEILGLMGQSAQALLGKVLGACKLMLPVMLIINLLVAYGKAILLRKGVEISFAPIIKGLMLMLILMSYPELAQLIGAGVSVFTHSLGDPPSFADTLAAFSAPYLDQIAELKGDSWVDQLLDTAADLGNALMGLDDLIVSLISGEILALIRVVMHFLQQITLSFLYIVGPIALCLSILPSFGATGEIWLKGYVGVGFWALTMRILDWLAYGFGQAFHHHNSLGLTALYEGGWFEAANLVLIIMYLLVPTLTNYYLRVGSAGDFIGKVGGTATRAAMMR